MTRKISLLFAACTALVVPGVWGQDLPSLSLLKVGMQPTAVMPQDDVLPATLGMVYAQKEDIDQALVVVEMGQGEENPRWMMSPTQMTVFIDTLLQFMPDKPQPEDAIWPKLKPVDPAYRGVRVVLHTVYGKHFEPFTIHDGQVKTVNGLLMTPDYGRRLEYWMFGTSRVRRDQLVGAHVMPVLTFEQCRLLGQQIIETKPRQCLLPDNNLLLESEERPTLQSARIKDFDGCLKNGKALIYTFPRRCMAAGGRVFTEPPKVYEAPAPLPADAPLALPPSGSLPAGTDLKMPSANGAVAVPTGVGSPLQLDMSHDLGGPVVPTPAGGL